MSFNFITDELRAYIDMANTQSIERTGKPVVAMSSFEKRVYRAKAWTWLSWALILLPVVSVPVILLAR